MKTIKMDERWQNKKVKKKELHFFLIIFFFFSFHFHRNFFFKMSQIKNIFRYSDYERGLKKKNGNKIF